MPNVRVGDIRPNPFRDIDNYPISESKVEELQASFNTTRVWPNVIARRVDGTVEIAYGHHRLEAARREYGEDYKYPLVIEDLTDDEMFKMMASENMDVYAASAQVVQNTVSSLVKAYADDKVHVVPPPTKTSEMRYAPSFRLDARGTDIAHPYTAETLRAYLGWTSVHKVKEALQALELTEVGLVKRSDFEGLSMKQAKAVTSSVHRAERATKPGSGRKVTGDVVAAVRKTAVAVAKSGAGHEVIQQMAGDRLDKEAPRTSKEKVANKVAQELARDIKGFWDQNLDLGNGRKQSRRAVMQTIAANQHAVGVRQWVGSLRTALNTMTAINEEFIEALDNERKLEVS